MDTGANKAKLRGSHSGVKQAMLSVLFASASHVTYQVLVQSLRITVIQRGRTPTDAELIARLQLNSTAGCFCCEGSLVLVPCGACRGRARPSISDLL